MIKSRMLLLNVLLCFSILALMSISFSSFIIVGNENNEAKNSAFVGEVISSSEYLTINNFGMSGYNQYGFYEDETFVNEAKFSGNIGFNYARIYQQLPNNDKPNILFIDIRLSQTSGRGSLNFIECISESNCFVLKDDIDNSGYDITSVNASVDNSTVSIITEINIVDNNIENLSLNFEFISDLSGIIQNSFEEDVFTKLSSQSFVFLLEGEVYEQK